MTISLSEGKVDRFCSDFDKAVNAVREAVTVDSDTVAIAGAAASVYVHFLERILALSRRFDEAQHQCSKESMRAARLAMRDQQDFLNLADRVVRGLYDSVGMRPRLWLDATAKAHGG